MCGVYLFPCGCVQGPAESHYGGIHNLLPESQPTMKGKKVKENGDLTGEIVTLLGVIELAVE